VKLIDIISARLDARTDSYVATLPSLQLKDVGIEDKLVRDNERMLTGGFYAEVDLGYDAVIAQEKHGRPFSVSALRPIQLSKRDVLDALCAGRKQFGASEWKDFLLRSVGLEPTGMTERNRDAMLLRMVPFVENNYNLVEIGPRGTGKSHLYQQISPYAHLVSGGKATVARMFVNNANGQRGLVCLYDVVCFDEVSGVSFAMKDSTGIFRGTLQEGKDERPQ
jgi:ATP-dependent Lon protease